MRRFRDYYGAQPLHLLAAIASFALVGAGFAGWIAPGSDARGILTWFIGCLIGFQLVLAPLAWLLDRIAFGFTITRSHQRGPRRAAGVYVRVPALLSALLLLTFMPLILQFDNRDFAAASGLLPTGYLARWLYATAGLFGCSAVTYAINLGRSRRTQQRDRPGP